MQRRHLLATAAACAVARPLPLAAQQDPGDCKARHSIGDWTYDARLTGDWREDPDAHSESELRRAAHLTATLTRSTVVPGRHNGKRITDIGEMDLVLVFPPGRDNIPDVKFSPGGVGLETGERISAPELLANDIEMQISVDDTPMGTTSSVDYHLVTLEDLSEPVYRALFDAQEIRLDMTAGGDRVMSAYIDLSGIYFAIENGTGVVIDKLIRTVRKDGFCSEEVDCVMTTAAVGLLGRADDCFELTQMRRLRAQFGGAEPQVLSDYVTSSRRILSQPPTPARRAAILAFWALVVIPAAALARVGAMRAARGVYLRGFSLLRRLLA